MLFSSGSVKRDQLGRDHDVGAREPVERVHPVEEAGRGHDAELLMLEVDERRDLLKILERVRAGEGGDVFVRRDVDAARPEFVHDAQHVGAGNERHARGGLEPEKFVREFPVVFAHRKAIPDSPGEVAALDADPFAFHLQGFDELTAREAVFVFGEDRGFLHAVFEEESHAQAGYLGAVELDDVKIVVTVVGIEEGVDRGDALETLVQTGAQFRVFRFAADDRAVAVVRVQALRDRAVLADDAELHGDVEFLKLLEHGGDEARGGAPVKILFDGGDR